MCIFKVYNNSNDKFFVVINVIDYFTWVRYNVMYIIFSRVEVGS